MSSHDQKDDLTRQSSVLKQSGVNKIISDIGSGLNFNKKGFSTLIKLLFSGIVSEIKIIEKDRLLRFGFPLLEKLCAHFNTKITILRQKPQLSFENQLAEDLISIITVFSAKLYGKRSHANKKNTVTWYIWFFSGFIVILFHKQRINWHWLTPIHELLRLIQR